MRQPTPPAENETKALKARIGLLEVFRTIGLLYGVLIGVVLVLAVIFFAFQNRQLSKQLSAIADSLDSASGTLQQVRLLSSDTAAQSGISAQKFEAFENMLGQAIAAADEATQAAASSLEASDQAGRATSELRLQVAKAERVSAEAMQEALTAKTVADRNFSRLRTFGDSRTAAAPGIEEGGEIDVFIDGSNIKLWFREGAARSRTIRIEESNYSDVVKIPPGATATLRGSCNGCEFRIERKLKGRVTEELSGSNNLFIGK